MAATSSGEGFAGLRVEAGRELVDLSGFSDEGALDLAIEPPQLDGALDDESDTCCADEQDRCESENSDAESETASWWRRGRRRVALS